MKKNINLNVLILFLMMMSLPQDSLGIVKQWSQSAHFGCKELSKRHGPQPKNKDKQAAPEEETKSVEGVGQGVNKNAEIIPGEFNLIPTLKMEAETIGKARKKTRKK